MPGRASWVRTIGLDTVFKDTALVLLAHGTELNKSSADPVRMHARNIADLGLFADVREAFWKQEPHALTVLGQLSVKRVVIVPFFLSEGYFCDVVIPRGLGLLKIEGGNGNRMRRDNGVELCYARALGADSLIAGCVLSRARGVVREFPFPREPIPSEISLFLAGHGTERNSQSREAVELHAAAIRATGEYASSQTVFLEESPRISEVHRLARTRHIVVVPFFTSDGLHTQEDIPVLLGEPERVVRQRLAEGKPPWRNPTEKHGKLIWYSSALGSEPNITGLIIERAVSAMRVAWPGMPEAELPKRPTLP